MMISNSSRSSAISAGLRVSPGHWANREPPPQRAARLDRGRSAIGAGGMTMGLRMVSVLTPLW
jgi:hypothetical protein